jgi:hypothetical protein
MKRFTYLLCTLGFALLTTGCSTMAPQYSGSLDNVAALQNQGGQAKVGAIQSSPSKENANPISLRGNSMKSPYQDSYASYLAEALKQDLTLAGKYSANSDNEISGTLMKNDLDASGFSTGHGVMEARIVVKNHDTVKYDKVHTAQHDWDSSFVGGIAIPNAVAAYPVLVKKLLTLVYADPDFAAALK